MNESIESTSVATGDGQNKRLLQLVVVLILLAIILIAVQILQPFADPPMDPPVITTEGLPASVAREIDNMYAEVLREMDSAEAWGKLGMLLVAHNSHSQAGQCFRYAQLLDPVEFQWPYLLGVSLSASDPPAALQPLREAIALRGDVAVAHSRLGELLLETGQLDEAEQHLNLALQIDENDLHAVIASGRLHLARGDVESSMRLAERASLLGPNVRAAHELLAHVHQRSGNRTAALRELEIIESLPDVPFEYNDPIAAQVVELQPDEQRRIQQAQRLLAEGKYKEAIELLSAAWEDDPTDPTLPCELARALAQVNQPTLAASVLERAAQQHPTSALVRMQRGVLYYLSSDYPNAARSFTEAIERKPDYAVAYYYLGQSHDKAGAQREAIAAFRAAIQLQPNYLDPHKSLGRVLLQLGELEAAKPHLRKVLEFVPQDTEAQELYDRANSATARIPEESPTTAVDENRESGR